MPDVIYVPIPGLGILSLSREQFDAALAAGRTFQREDSVAAPGAPRVVTAEELEASTGVPRSWWMTQARQRRIPCRKMGRRVRFVLDEVLGCETFRRRAKEER